MSNKGAEVRGYVAAKNKISALSSAAAQGPQMAHAVQLDSHGSVAPREFEGPVLLSIASALPRQSWSTQELIALAGQRFSPSLQDMIGRFGVANRHSILSNYDQVLFRSAEPKWDERGTCLGVRAARSCIERGGISPESISLVIAVTSTPSRIVPGFVSDLYSEMMELPRESMNLSLQGQGCSPLLKAIDTARWYLRDRPNKHVLIVCMESPTPMSRPLNEDGYLSFAEGKSSQERQRTVDVLHALLFADAAVALLLGSDGDGPVFGPTAHLTNHKSQDAELGHIVGAGSDKPEIHGRPEYRLGPDIAPRGTFYSQKTVSALLNRNDCPIKSASDASLALVHTGSQKILESVGAAIGVSQEMIAPSYLVLAKYGNLIGASLGMMLADSLPGAKGHILMVTFGLSFSASAGILNTRN